MKEYFISFVVGNYTGMHDLQADNFRITDIRKSSSPFPLLDSYPSNTPFRYSSRYRQSRQRAMARRKQRIQFPHDRRQSPSHLHRRKFRPLQIRHHGERGVVHACG